MLAFENFSINLLTLLAFLINEIRSIPYIISYKHIDLNLPVHQLLLIQNNPHFENPVAQSIRIARNRGTPGATREFRIELSTSGRARYKLIRVRVVSVARRH